MSDDDLDFVPSSDNEANNEKEQEKNHQHEENNVKLTYPLLNLQFTNNKQYRNIKTKQVINEYDVVGKFVKYLQKLIGRKYCRYFNNQTRSKCACLHNELEVNTNTTVAVALFMVSANMQLFYKYNVFNHYFSILDLLQCIYIICKLN